MDSKYEFMKGIQEMSSQKMGVGDEQMKGFKYEDGGVDKSDSFVVDLENLSSVNENEPPNVSTTSTNSRITLQRSLSRKVPQRGAERNFADRDSLTLSSSPKAAQAISSPQKSLASPKTSMGSQDNSLNYQLPQHQITIKTGGMNTVPDGRWGRRPSFKRRFTDPKRVLLFFATLSTMGTMLLIYFTLSMNKRNAKEVELDWR